MSNPWFRFYHEWDADPKVQMLSEAMQRRLVMLFCSRCKGETLQETERAFHWRISAQELTETKAAFLEKGFIDEDWNVVNWDRRQFISDNVAERVRRFRERRKQGGTLPKQNETLPQQDETPDETAPDTEQIQNQKQKKQAKGKPLPWNLPEWIERDVWDAFEEMRRKMKKPMTDRARQNIVAALIRFEAAGMIASEVLEQSITNGWSGVYPLNRENIKQSRLDAANVGAGDGNITPMTDEDRQRLAAAGIKIADWGSNAAVKP